MTKTETTTVERIGNDAEVQATRARLAEGRSRLADANARAARPWGTTTPETRSQREAREEAQELTPAVAAVERDVAAAEAEAQARIIAARRPGQLALDRALLAAIEPAHALAIKRQRYDEATAVLLGLAPPPFVAPALLALGDPIARLRRAIDGPPPPAPAPPPVPGKRRLRLLASLYDRDAIQYRIAGDVFDADDAVARDLVKRKVAVEVAGA